MKGVRWHLTLSGSLISLSLIFYLIQIAIFHKTEDTFFYMLQDIAFVPIQVLLVSLIIERLLSYREKRERFNRLNMLIGAFYSEVGTPLIAYCSEFSLDLSALKPYSHVSGKWSDKDFSNALRDIGNMSLEIDSRKTELSRLKDFLVSKRAFLLSLLANPNLMEHETFTELLWAVFHLTEELTVRKSLAGLPGPDYDHLSGDIRRSYMLLLTSWFAYMQHLKHDYPYIFSLALRTNPLDTEADPVVKSV